ncbi:MAG: CBS domain-containing protein [Sphingomonadales bacterium]|nr:CBS domain-containing protein [Sphingomonadales bacterium]
MTVKHILGDKGSEIISVEETDTVISAIQLLKEKRIGAVLVKSAGKIAGILSERDIVRALVEEGGGLLQQPVSGLMTRDVVTCAPHESIAEVMSLMTERRIRHLPVVEDDELVGMISIGDVVKQRIAETEQEANALKEYIATG